MGTRPAPISALFLWTECRHSTPICASNELSPISRWRSHRETTGSKQRCGTKENWLLIIPTRRALVFSDRAERILNENDDFRSDLIPGFSIRLKDLFDRA